MTTLRASTPSSGLLELPKQAQTQNGTQTGQNKQPTVAQAFIDAHKPDTASTLPIWRPSLKGVPVPSTQLYGEVNGNPFRPNTAALFSRLLKLQLISQLGVDLEFVIGLPLKKGESLVGQQFIVKPDDVDADMPAVSLRYREPGEKIPTGGNLYHNGFSMKLKLGEMKENGNIPAALYLCLPDEGRSFIAGRCMVRNQ